MVENTLAFPTSGWHAILSGSQWHRLPSNKKSFYRKAPSGYYHLKDPQKSKPNGGTTAALPAFGTSPDPFANFTRKSADALLKRVGPILKPDPEAVGTGATAYRGILSKMPGMSTEVYDKMLKQAEDSARLNMGLAMMQAGFGAAAAPRERGESTFSTLSRTLFQPLSAAAMQTMGAARKEKMAAQLGKLQAEGRLSTAAFQAAMADETTARKTLATMLGKKGPTIKATKTPIRINMEEDPSKPARWVEGLAVIQTVGDQVRTSLASDMALPPDPEGRARKVAAGRVLTAGNDFLNFQPSGTKGKASKYTPDTRSAWFTPKSKAFFEAVAGRGAWSDDLVDKEVRVTTYQPKGDFPDLPAYTRFTIGGKTYDTRKPAPGQDIEGRDPNNLLGDAFTYTDPKADKDKDQIASRGWYKLNNGTIVPGERLKQDNKWGLYEPSSGMKLILTGPDKNAEAVPAPAADKDKTTYTGNFVVVDQNKKGLMKDNKLVQVRLGSDNNYYRVGDDEKYTMPKGYRAMTLADYDQVIKPTEPKGMETPKFKQAFDAFLSGAGSRVRILGQDKNIGFSDGKFTYRNNAGDVKIFDDTSQKIFKGSLANELFLNIGGEEGLKTFQIGNAKTGSLIDEVITRWFARTPKEILGASGFLTPAGSAPAAPITTGAVSLPSDFTPIDLSATGQKTRFKKARKNMIDNNVAPAVALANLRESGSDTVSSTGAGRLVDAVKVSPEIFGAETLDIKNPDAIQKRLIYENKMKSVPPDKTKLSVIGDPINRHSVITKAVNDYNAARDKKWNTNQNQKLTINYKDLVRSIGIVDKYSRAAGAANVEGFVKGPMRSFLERKGLSILDPTTWFESEDATEMRREIVALAANLEQLIGRGLLKESGDSRFSDKDVEGIKTVIANLNDTQDYNAEKLSQLRNFMMNGLRSMLNQTGSFRLDDADIAEAIKLGVDPREVRISHPEKGHYSKYASVADRTYAVSGQKAPGATAQDLTNLKQQGVFEMFKKPSGYYEIIKTQNVQGVIQPVMTGGKFETIKVSEDTLFTPAMKPHTDYTYRVFQKRLGR